MKPSRGAYAAGGAKLSYHGMDYQFQLLMLFALRALNLDYSHFSLSTEMQDAHKIDDLVFSYRKVKTSTRRHFRFLQAKHANDQAKKKISAANLLDEGNGSLSLKTYFHSFRSISRNRDILAENDTIQDLIICTNVDFSYGSECGGFELREDAFEKVMTEGGEEWEDDILGTVLVKFKKEFEGRGGIVEYLKRNAIEMPREFAVSLMKRCRYIHKKCNGMDSGLFVRYERALVEEVVDPSCGKFRDGFVLGENLSKTAEHFREVITAVYMKSYQGDGDKNEETLRSFLAKETVLSNWEAIQPEDCIRNPRKLSKKLAELLRRNREGKWIKVDDEGSLVARNLRALNTCAWERDGSKFKFREEFIAGTLVLENSKEFRERLHEQLKFFKLDIEDLRGYTFDIAIPPLLVRFEESDFTLEEEVAAFLDKLVFVVNYPALSSLEDMIMDDISKIFNPSHKRNVFSRFLMMIQNWLMEKEGRALTRSDVEAFFDGLKAEMEGSLNFELGEPVTSFSGRKKELSLLRMMLIEKENGAANRMVPRFVSVVGPAGVGKSELAKKHAKENLSYYRSVVWLEVGSRENLEESFHRLAFDTMGASKVNAQGKVRDLETVVGEVYDYFIGKTCLFVFDDVTLESDLENFLPQSPKISHLSVILTSRYGDWGFTEKLNLLEFSSEEAIEFLNVGFLSTFTTEESKELANALKFLPLAMQQATYCIRTRNTPPSVGLFRTTDYLDLLKRKTTELAGWYIEEEQQGLCLHPEYMAILITRDILGNLDHGVDVLNTLNFISYMSPGNVDLDLARKLSGKNYDAVLLSLKECNFISINNWKITVDRSVALVTRIFLRKEDKEESLLREIVETDFKFKIVHLHTIWFYCTRYGELVKDFSHIPMRIIDSITRKGFDERAFTYGTNAIEVLSHNVEGDHFSIVSILFKMICGSRGQRHKKLAHVLRNNLLHDMEYFWQNNNNDVKYLLRQGLVLFLMHKCRKALNIFESISINKNSIPGVNADFMAHIAKFYIAKLIIRDSIGLNSEMIDILKELEDYCENIIGNNETAIAEILENNRERFREIMFYYYAASESLKRNRRYEDAFRLLKCNFELCKSLLGEDAIVSQWAKKELGLLLLYTNEVNQAVNVLEEVRQNLSKFLDVSNVYYLSTIRLLAFALSRSGKHVKALHYYEESYDFYHMLLGELHPTTLNLNAFICVELILLDRTDKAVSILKPVPALKKQEYFRTLLFQAKKLVKLGKAAGALYILTYLLGAYEESYGEESLQTLEIMLEVGFAYFEVGSESSFAKGWEYLTKVDDALEVFYSLDNADVCRMKRRIADFLLRLRKINLGHRNR